MLSYTIVDFQLNSLNGIIHLPFLALSIIIFKGYQDKNWKLVSQQLALYDLVIRPFIINMYDFYMIILEG